MEARLSHWVNGSLSGFWLLDGTAAAPSRKVSAILNHAVWQPGSFFRNG